MSNEPRLPFGDILLDEQASDIVRRLCSTYPPLISHDQWKERLLSLSDRIAFQPAAPDKAISDLEQYLGLSLPEDLRAVWRFTSAITFDDLDHILYPPELVRSTHQELVAMDHWMPLAHLVFIGSLGDGDQFAFGRCVSGEFHPSIFR